MHRSANSTFDSRRPKTCIPSRPSSSDANDVHYLRTYLKSDGTLTLGQSFDFVVGSFSSSDIELDQEDKAFRSRDSQKNPLVAWSSLYTRVVHDIRVSLALALVPLVHKQVSGKISER